MRVIVVPRDISIDSNWRVRLVHRLQKPLGPLCSQASICCQRSFGYSRQRSRFIDSTTFAKKPRQYTFEIIHFQFSWIWLFWVQHSPISSCDPLRTQNSYQGNKRHSIRLRTPKCECINDPKTTDREKWSQRNLKVSLSGKNEPANSLRAFSKFLNTSTSKSLVGSSNSNTLGPSLSILANCTRFLSPPLQSSTGLWWSSPLKLNYSWERSTKTYSWDESSHVHLISSHVNDIITIRNRF